MSHGTEVTRILILLTEKEPSPLAWASNCIVRPSLLPFAGLTRNDDSLPRDGPKWNGVYFIFTYEYFPSNF